jgi:hypothetical protein
MAAAYTVRDRLLERWIKSGRSIRWLLTHSRWASRESMRYARIMMGSGVRRVWDMNDK